MEIAIQMDAAKGEARVALDGRLDTATAPMLEGKRKELEGAKRIDMDFEKLRYISSAGLRVLLMMQKQARAKGGEVVIHHANAMVREVFEATGFVDLFSMPDD